MRWEDPLMIGQFRYSTGLPVLERDCLCRAPCLPTGGGEDGPGGEGVEVFCTQQPFTIGSRAAGEGDPLTESAGPCPQQVKRRSALS